MNVFEAAGKMKGGRKAVGDHTKAEKAPVAARKRGGTSIASSIKTLDEKLFKY